MLELPEDGEGLRWIISQGPSQLLLIPGLHPASIVAAAAGDAEALSFLHSRAQQHAASGSRSITPLDETCAEASRATSFAKLEEVRNTLEGNQQVGKAYVARRTYTLKLLHAAAKGGCLAALQWLQALCHHSVPVNDDNDTRELLEDAAEGGHLNILKHLCSGIACPPWPPTILALAANHPECLEWLLRQEPQCPHDEDTLPEVAAAGNLPALQYLRLHPEKFMPLTDWNEDVTTRAAQAGQLAVIQWLRGLNPPVPWDKTASSGAAYYGHLSVLQWIHGQVPPCPWSSVSTRNAAFVGELGILQWLRTRSSPCPWDASCAAAAAEQQPKFFISEIERLTVGQDPPSATDALHMRNAACKQDLATLQWLRNQTPPAPWDERCTEAAAGNDITILKWILSQDPPCPLRPDSWSQAVCRGNLPMLKLLSKHGCMPTGQAYYEAAWRGHISILRWLHRKQVPVPNAHSTPPTVCISSPVLLFLGDIHAPLPPPEQSQLMLARKTFCTFHGLLRWCRHAVSDPSRGMDRAFDALSTDTSGQTLLVWLSLLPPDLRNKIAVAAGLQHDLFVGRAHDD